MPTTPSKTILFITGAFVSHHSWDDWIPFFQNNGYTVSAPAWPYKDASVNILRNRHPDREVASIRLAELIAHYEVIAKSQSEKPIIIGHSIGGLVAQILLQKGLAASVVAIHSVPPQGVFTFKLSFFLAGWGPLGYFTSTQKTFLMSLSQWEYAFTNGMPEEWQEKTYFSLAIPESKQLVRDTVTAVAKVDFNKPHAPLLFIAGKDDHTIPSSLNYRNYKKYTDIASITAYIEFAGRNHFVLGQPGWEEIALHILNWIRNPVN